MSDGEKKFASQEEIDAIVKDLERLNAALPNMPIIIDDPLKAVMSEEEPAELKVLDEEELQELTAAMNKAALKYLDAVLMLSISADVEKVMENFAMGGPGKSSEVIDTWLLVPGSEPMEFHRYEGDPEPRIKYYREDFEQDFKVAVDGSRLSKYAPALQYDVLERRTVNVTDQSLFVCYVSTRDWDRFKKLIDSIVREYCKRPR